MAQIAQTWIKLGTAADQFRQQIEEGITVLQKYVEILEELNDLAQKVHDRKEKTTTYIKSSK